MCQYRRRLAILSSRARSSSLLPGRHVLAWTGFLAVAIALQRFLPDGALDANDRIGPVLRVFFEDVGAIEQKVNDVDLCPRVELLHEALWLFLFGHGFVPFG